MEVKIIKKTIVLLFLLLAVPCGADVITVYPDGSGDYPTIQAAIDAAFADDTVIVVEGTYTENISAGTEITINFTGTTTINGQVTTGIGTDIIADADLTINSDSDITLGGPVTVAGMLELYADGTIVINNTLHTSGIEMITGGGININGPVNGTVSVDIYAGADITITDVVTGGYVDVYAEGFVIVEIGPLPLVLLADAGEDQTVFAWIDDIAEVQLAGSASVSAGSGSGGGGYIGEFEYNWSWEIDGEFYDANGVDPVIELPTGEHTISLVVNGGTMYSEPNEVVVTVVESIEATVLVRPGVLNRRSANGKMKAWMHLPAGITKEMFDSQQKLMLYPGGVEALSQRVFHPRGPGSRGRGTSILAFFDRGDVLDAIDDNGKVDIDIVGELKSGQYVHGTDSIRIIQPRR